MTITKYNPDEIDLNRITRALVFKLKIEGAIQVSLEIFDEEYELELVIDAIKVTKRFPSKEYEHTLEFQLDIIDNFQVLMEEYEQKNAKYQERISYLAGGKTEEDIE